ncbi:MAG: hypothetical protein AAF570_12430, partial [Bacteroidota bacterium]
MDHHPMSTTSHTPTQENAALQDGRSALDLVLGRVRLLARRRVMWLREIWREAGQESEGRLNFHGMVDTILAERDQVELERAWQVSHPDLQELNAQLAEIEQSLAEMQQTRLTYLCWRFGLSREEIDLLHACLALALDPELERVFSYLQDHNARGYVTLALVRKLFGYRHNLSPISFHNLKTWRFIVTRPNVANEPTRFDLDEWVVSWLMGMDNLDPVLLGKADFPEAKAPLANWPTEEGIGWLRKVWDRNAQQKLRLLIEGMPGSGRKTMAATIARENGFPLMVVNLGELTGDAWEMTYVHAQRQAFLNGFAVGWTHEDIGELNWPVDVLPVPLQFIFMEQDLAIHPGDRVVDMKLTIPPLSIPERKTLWEALVPASKLWVPQTFEAIVQRYKTTIGQIAAVRAKAADTPEEAIEVLRSGTRYRLGKLAQRLPATFTWEDLTLPPFLEESLQDLVFEAKEREIWWENAAAKRLFPQGKGLLALFTGPPGTG